MQSSWLALPLKDYIESQARVAEQKATTV